MKETIYLHIVQNYFYLELSIGRNYFSLMSLALLGLRRLIHAEINMRGRRYLRCVAHRLCV